MSIYPDEGWQQECDESRDAAALAHGPIAYYNHKEHAVGELRGLLLCPTLLTVPPVYHIAVDEPDGVDHNDNEHSQKQPQVLVLELLHLHQLVEGHDHVCQIYTKRHLEPNFYPSTVCL